MFRGCRSIVKLIGRRRIFNPIVKLPDILIELKTVGCITIVLTSKRSLQLVGSSFVHAIMPQTSIPPVGFLPKARIPLKTANRYLIEEKKII